MKNDRFVVQEHTTPEGVHWDLMLERGDALLTFRLDTPPQQVGRGPIRAVKIFDHPLRFLSYEGPVQQATGRVHIVERGTCRLDEQGEDRLTFDLDGAVLKGNFMLSRDEGTLWRLTSERPPQNG